MSKAELANLSSHWFRLTIHWHTAISPRPDIALVWRLNTKRREGTWEQREDDILREVYPSINKYSDIQPAQLLTYNYSIAPLSADTLSSLLEELQFLLA